MPEETQAAIGYGTLLSYQTGTTFASPPGSPPVPIPVFTKLAEVTDITGPGMSRELPDATHMCSPGGWREFLGGLKDAGEVTIEANHLPNHETQDATTGVLSLFASGARTAWRIQFPVSPEVVWEFDAVVSAFEPSFPVEDKMMLSVTLKVSGQPAFLNA